MNRGSEECWSCEAQRAAGGAREQLHSSSGRRSDDEVPGDREYDAGSVDRFPLVKMGKNRKGLVKEM